MGFYNRHILPRCLDMACGMAPIAKQRQKIIPLAKGKVVEVGMGSCLNLPFYDANQVREVIGIEPDAHIWKRGAALRKASPISCLLYTSPSPRDLSTSRMPSSA